MRVEEELCCHGQSSSKICNLVEVSLNIVLTLNIPDTRDDIHVYATRMCFALKYIFLEIIPNANVSTACRPITSIKL